MTTSNLDLPTLVHREKNGEVTHNESIQKLDIYSQPRVEAILSAQPVSPTDGQIWIVGAGATGSEWLGQDNKLAHYWSTVWHFYVPNMLMIFLNKSDNHYYSFDGVNWVRRLWLPCYGETDLLAPLTPAQALGAAVTVSVHAFNNLAVPAKNMAVTLTPIENANFAVFLPDPDYYGTVIVEITLELLAVSSGVFQFFCWDGTKDHLIGTRDLTTDTLTICHFSGAVPIQITTGIPLEFRVQCSVAQSVVWNSLSANIRRIDV